MAHLMGRFVGLLQVSVAVEQQQDLEVALRMIRDLDVMIASDEMCGRPVPLRQFDLEIVGSDHSGIVRDVFRGLAEAGVNIEELETAMVPAPESGDSIFQAKARLACVPSLDRGVIRANLEKIAHDIMVDIRLFDSCAGMR